MHPPEVAMFRHVRLLIAGLALVPSLVQAQPVALDGPDLARAAHRVVPGGALEVSLGLGSEPARLELERFSVFEPGAVVTIHGDGGRVERRPAPDHAFFRGTVAGSPGSRAFLVVRESGALRGLVTTAKGVTMLAGEAGGVPGTRELAATELHGLSGPGFECGAAGHELDLADLIEAKPGSAGAPVPFGNLSYTARVAIETDFEYLGKFGGSTTAATDYAGDLIGFASTIYDGEIATNLTIPTLSLWTTAADPWAQTTSTCGFFEFGKYWNTNHGGTSRTLAHFLSGKSSNSGIGWIGVLCSGSFSYTTHQAPNPDPCPSLADNDTYGGGYGFTSGIDGNFDPDNPTVLWDIVAVAHEIGHNFNSPHTHCYANIGGNASTVDACFAGECGNSGCYCGSTSLPGGAGSGTIMSYCHLLAGGLSNLSLNFGTGHPFGTVPQRVPDRMRAHVESRAASNPSCLERIDGSVIFENGFEAGNTASWDLVTP
jgi:hypothetical protein